MLRAITLLHLVAVRADWSFKKYFEGEWVLERTRSGVVTRAYYVINASAEGLKGNYYEDGTDEPMNHMHVRVLFDDDSGRSGSFQLAKVQQMASWDTDEEPEPEPAHVSQQKTVFKFLFTPQMDERYP